MKVTLIIKVTFFMHYLKSYFIKLMRYIMRKKIDYKMLGIIITLVLFGLLMVYSSSNVVANFRYNDSLYYFKRQLLFSIIGIIIMFYISKIDIYKIRKYSSIFFFICIFLLILVLIVSTARGGAKSWLGFGSFSIQPSEFMKIALILVLSNYLSKYYSDLKKLKNFIFVLGLILAVFGLIMLQPDFGTGLVIVLSGISLLFISGAPLKYFIILISFGVLGLGVLILSAPYRLDRILAFINPWNDPLGSGFQGIQSIIAVAPSGLFGLGFNQSIQKRFFLPEPQNDFIFAIICEELGLIGAVFLVSLYFLFVYKAIKLSIKVSDRYLSFLSLGIGLSIFIQAAINICVVIGLLPITGITLPFISYGGSSLVITLIGCGILLNISKYEGVI